MGRRGQGQDRRPARRSTRTSSAATRAGRTPGTRSSSAARRSSSGTCPSGILSGKECVIGAGCVVDPEVLIEELDELEARGHLDRRRAPLGQRAPDHAVARRDRPGAASGGSASSRSARRGAASARPTPTRRTRLGIRVQDLLDPKILRQKIEVALAEKNVWLERVYGVEPLELEELADALRGLRAAAAAVRRRHVAARRPRAARRQARALRGRAGDAARPRPRHVSVRHLVEPDRRRRRDRASGSGRRGSTRVIGVAKAYVTRVGEGPFPTEIEGPDQERVRELGGEFGTVTGRERRCGWLDLVALRYAVRLNGITSLALTKLDVLSAFAELPVCVALPAARRHRDATSSPRTRATSTTAEPVYETLPGWERAARRRRRRSTSCPSAARALRRVRRAASSRSRSALVGTGAERERVLAPARARGAGPLGGRAAAQASTRGRERERAGRLAEPAEVLVAHRVCAPRASATQVLAAGADAEQERLPAARRSPRSVLETSSELGLDVLEARLAARARRARPARLYAAAPRPRRRASTSVADVPERRAAAPSRRRSPTTQAATIPPPRTTRRISATPATGSSMKWIDELRERGVERAVRPRQRPRPAPARTSASGTRAAHASTSGDGSTAATRRGTEPRGELLRSAIPEPQPTSSTRLARLDAGPVREHRREHRRVAAHEPVVGVTRDGEGHPRYLRSRAGPGQARRRAVSSSSSASRSASSPAARRRSSTGSALLAVRAGQRPGLRDRGVGARVGELEQERAA